MNEGIAEVLDLIFNDCPDDYARGNSRNREKYGATRCLSARVHVYGSFYGGEQGVPKEIMEAARHMPLAYNAFDREKFIAALGAIADLVLTRSDGKKYRFGQSMWMDFGREGSPVVYFTCAKDAVEPIRSILTTCGVMPDEFTYRTEGSELRCWWD